MPFNAVGFAMFVLAFGAGYGMQRTMGVDHEGVWMMCAGPVLVALDLGHRHVRRLPALARTVGSSIAFLPAWVWGAVWFVLGAVYLGRDRL